MGSDFDWFNCFETGLGYMLLVQRANCFIKVVVLLHVFARKTNKVQTARILFKKNILLKKRNERYNSNTHHI
jgi:hypothetical protein